MFNLVKTLMNYETLFTQIKTAMNEGKAYVRYDVGEDYVGYFTCGINGLTLYTEEEYMTIKYDQYQNALTGWDMEEENEPFPFDSFEEWLEQDTDSHFISLVYIYQELFELVSINDRSKVS